MRQLLRSNTAESGVSGCAWGTAELHRMLVSMAERGELISEITLAMQSGIGLARLPDVVHPYPTRAEAIRKLGDQYNRTRLTPFRQRLLGRLFAWRR